MFISSFLLSTGNDLLSNELLNIRYLSFFGNRFQVLNRLFVERSVYRRLRYALGVSLAGHFVPRFFRYSTRDYRSFHVLLGMLCPVYGRQVRRVLYVNARGVIRRFSGQEFVLSLQIRVSSV